MITRKISFSKHSNKWFVFLLIMSTLSTSVLGIHIDVEKTDNLQQANETSNNTFSNSSKSQEESKKNLEHAGNDNADVLIQSDKIPVETDFDSLRKYESYDPQTGIWSKIEDFKSVEILEDTTQHRAEEYIYKNFWAYDTKNKKWKRVNIRNYGYKQFGEQSKNDEKEKSSTSFWKNLGISFSAGASGAYFKNVVKEMNFIQRTGANGNKEYFLQASADEQQGKAHQINWFYKNFVKITGVNPASSALVSNNSGLQKIPAGNIFFTGMGVTIPFMGELHYTFFDKLRISTGIDFEIIKLDVLKAAGDASSIGEYKLLTNNWFYNAKWFGGLGYQLYKKRTHAVILDARMGLVVDLGGEPGDYFFRNVGPIHQTFYGNLGVKHEKKLNDFFKVFYRLSFTYKQYTDDNIFAPIEKASNTSFQPTLGFELGTSLNFGRDDKAKDEDMPNKKKKRRSGSSNDRKQSKPARALNKAENKITQAENTESRIKQDGRLLKSLF